MTNLVLLTIEEAAAIYRPGMKPHAFRRKILPVLVERHGARIRQGKGRRYILVIGAALDALIREEQGLTG